MTKVEEAINGAKVAGTLMRSAGPIAALTVVVIVLVGFIIFEQVQSRIIWSDRFTGTEGRLLEGRVEQRLDGQFEKTIEFIDDEIKSHEGRGPHTPVPAELATLKTQIEEVLRRLERIEGRLQ